MRAEATFALAGIAAACGGLAWAQAAEPIHACGPRLIVEYRDESPDSFLIRNASGEGWQLAVVAIDLAGSAGDLVFDTDIGGAGAGTPAPFNPTLGAGPTLLGATPASDGGRSVTLRFAGFDAGARFVFHVDVDDQLPNSLLGQTNVAGEEIAGAAVTAVFHGPGETPANIVAVFDREASADSGIGGCV